MPMVEEHIMADAVQMLEEQHAEATALFMKLERLTDPPVLAAHFRTLDSRLRDHAIIEEEIFYPAFRERAKATGNSEVDEALHEHDEMKAALAEVEKTSATDYTFKQRIAELKRIVEHHVKEEEGGILLQARSLFSESELDELGYRMMKLMSIHSPVYQVGGNKVATIARDTVRHVGELLEKITG
jgi:hemerythrin superfamily protein